MRSMHTSKLRGFTLIELLVVITIIGVLASVVLASLNTAREKSRDATRMSQLKEVQKALEAYYADNGSYPTTGGAWRGTSAGCYGGHGNNAIPGLAPTYISAVPEDTRPSGSSCYLYRSNGTDYMFLANQTIESFDPDGPPAHPMDRVNYNQQSIAVYSPGARSW